MTRMQQFKSGFRTGLIIGVPLLLLAQFGLDMLSLGVGAIVVIFVESLK